MDNIIKIIITFVLIATNASWAHETESITFQGTQFLEKTPVSDYFTGCEIEKKLEDTQVNYLDSDDDQFHIEIEGDQNLLKKISIAVTSDKILIKETPIACDSMQTIRGDHPFFETKYATHIQADGGIFMGPKTIMNGFLILEDGNYWKIPTIYIHTPERCRKIMQEQRKRIIQNCSHKIINVVKTKLENKLSKYLTEEGIDRCFEDLDLSLNLYLTVALSSLSNSNPTIIAIELENFIKKWEDSLWAEIRKHTHISSFFRINVIRFIYPELTTIIQEALEDF